MANQTFDNTEEVPEVENQADADDAALDAFIEANRAKILAFFRDLLASYERGEAESKESEESEPDEEEPKSARGKTVRAFRNGQSIGVGG